MSHTQSRSFPLWGKLAVALAVIALLRVNLPPDNIASSTDLSHLQGFSRVAGDAFVRILGSDLIADWEYWDLLVVKVARSERLGVTAVGLPFSKWKLYADEKR